MRRVRTSIQEAHKYLSGVDHSVAFYLKNGNKVNSLEELAGTLVTIDEDVYKHHVNPDKNDFANWIRDVIKDGILAKDLERARNRMSAAKKVSMRVNLLKEMIR